MHALIPQSSRFGLARSCRARLFPASRSTSPILLLWHVILKVARSLLTLKRSISITTSELHQALGYHAPRQVFEEAMRFTKFRRGRKTAEANCELEAQ